MPIMVWNAAFQKRNFAAKSKHVKHFETICPLGEHSWQDLRFEKYES